MLSIKMIMLRFVILDITIKEENFIYLYIYILLDKRDSFPFSNVRIADIDSNIPQNHFHEQQSKLSF